MHSFDRKTGTLAIFAAALTLICSKGEAATILWTLEDVNMTLGTSLEGTFTTDSATGHLTAYDIHVQGGSQSGYLFQDTISEDYIASDGPQNYEIENTGDGYITLSFMNSLTSGLSKVNISSSSFYCQACGDYSVSGASGFVAVPEPATWAIVLLGFAGVGAAARRWRREIALFN
ncbi:MAG: PEPxxWA-CTERM sorting domain-containing protein [Caulobacteraceae bacterium]